MEQLPANCGLLHSQGTAALSGQLPADVGQQRYREAASLAHSEQLPANLGQLHSRGIVSPAFSEPLPTDLSQQHVGQLQIRDSASSALAELLPSDFSQQKDWEAASSALPEQLPASAGVHSDALGGAQGNGKGRTLSQPPPCADFAGPCEDIGDWISRRSKKELIELARTACACFQDAWAEFALSIGISAKISKKVDASALRTFMAQALCAELLTDSAGKRFVGIGLKNACRCDHQSDGTRRTGISMETARLGRAQAA